MANWVVSGLYLFYLAVSKTAIRLTLVCQRHSVLILKAV